MVFSLRRLICLAGALCCAAVPANGLAQGTPAWIGQAANTFSASLYAKLAAGNGGNLFFSPLSIQTALAMARAGARGGTAEEMGSVLDLPPSTPGEPVDKGLVDFLQKLSVPAGLGGCELSVANALWGQKGFGFLPGFLSRLKTDYGAGLNEVNFRDHAESARTTINDWVEKETHDKITDLIGPGVLKPSTRLVLTNAIYFKGAWVAQFDPKATRDEPFHLSATQDKSVPMMRRTGRYNYMEGVDFQALQLPYKGNRLSMIILLPRHPEGLADAERDLAPQKLKAALGVLAAREVAVVIPRFKLTDQFELASVLEAMGMKMAFGPGADFSGMTGKRDLSISAVIHKAYVAVDEEGTEAAAATAIVMRTLAIREMTPPPEFRADRPFLFLIRDEASGAILFMGRVMEPG